MTEVTTPSGATEPPTGPPSGDVARAHWSKRRRILVSIGVAFAVLVTGALGFGIYAYNHLSANIATIVDTQDQTDRPAAVTPAEATPTAPLNILLIGSDSREGDNGFVGGIADAGRSDTTILLHVSGDRSRAYAVSIPRDSMVEMPSCRTTSGGTSTAGLRQFNEAYTLGGASCVRRTVEQLTDIRIDHFVVVDFAGFRDMVKALGGVKVNIPEPINDAEHGITLPAGCVNLDGDQSLAYVRVRHIGSGSDPERLLRQQAFMSSVIQKVTSKGTLTNPVKLYSFLDAATKSLSTDAALNNVSALAGLAQDLRQVGLDRIEFFTIPIEPYPADPNRLQWTAAAAPIWKALRNDKELPGSNPDKAPPLVAAPSTINVRVLNATNSIGAAADAAAELTALGYHVVEVTNAPKHRATTVVRWSPPRDESARTLAAATSAPVDEITGLDQVVELWVGKDYAGAKKVKVKGSAGPYASDLVTRTAAAPICS